MVIRQKSDVSFPSKLEWICTNFSELWALYKEVQQYYDTGLKIPDDVTLLFADDNFGTLRRLPFGEEIQRIGGSGVCSCLSLF